MLDREAKVRARHSHQRQVICFVFVFNKTNKTPAKVENASGELGGGGESDDTNDDASDRNNASSSS